MKSVSASIYFLSQRFAHVALEKVIDDQHQEYNNSDDEAGHKTNWKRNFTEEFSLQISISQFMGAQAKKAKTIWFTSALVQVRDGFWIP